MLTIASGAQPMPPRLSLRRRRLSILFLTIICIGIVQIVHKTLWTATEDLAAFKDENDNCGRFESSSRYRKEPDYNFERQIDSALLAIQHDLESKYSLHPPVRRIWQTWRDNVVPERFDQPATWRKKNPGWEHVVGVHHACVLMLADISFCSR